MTISKDIMGTAAKAFWFDLQTDDIMVKSSITEESVMPTSHLFRTYEEMSEIEQKAIDLCSGDVLDIGGGVGSHALELQNKGLNVSMIDVSEGCCEVAKERGVKNVIHNNIFQYSEKKFDTLLMMMNGIGLVGRLDNLPNFFEKCKSLLNEGGQIIFDSCDIMYMFQEEDGSLWMDLNAEYYGEVVYQMIYKNNKGDAFDWLYIDSDKMKEASEIAGFTFEMITSEEDGMYLGRLSV